MNRLLLLAAVLVSSLAFANAHHHAFGGGGGASGEDNPEGACLSWAPADAGVDAGAEAENEAADAGHAGEVCTERAKLLGCSAMPGAPVGLLALALARRRRAQR
jgi:hypothetical protein